MMAFKNPVRLAAYLLIVTILLLAIIYFFFEFKIAAPLMYSSIPGFAPRTNLIYLFRYGYPLILLLLEVIWTPFEMLYHIKSPALSLNFLFGLIINIVFSILIYKGNEKIRFAFVAYFGIQLGWFILSMFYLDNFFGGYHFAFIPFISLILIELLYILILLLLFSKSAKRAYRSLNQINEYTDEYSKM